MRFYTPTQPNACVNIVPVYKTSIKAHILQNVSITKAFIGWYRNNMHLWMVAFLLVLEDNFRLIGKIT